MDIRGMHYDFKQKLNKLDSQQYRNLRVPEIDWKLNEALEVFIKNIAQPRTSKHLGFETNQRSIDDIRTIVINNYKLDKPKIALKLDEDLYPREIEYALPEDYMFYISSRAILGKSICKDRVAIVKVQQHDDTHEESEFDKSSFTWKHVNIRFTSEGIKAFTDGTFEIKELIINYIKKPKYIHNAQDFLPTKTYKLPNGELLSGQQDCELPNHTHREIVDIAVMITSGDLQLPDYQIKQAKVNLNQN